MKSLHYFIEKWNPLLNYLNYLNNNNSLRNTTEQSLGWRAGKGNEGG
jgi:hypothetical protein